MATERLANSHNGVLFSLTSINIENEYILSHSSTVFEQKTRKVTSYAHEWGSQIKVNLKPNGVGTCKIPRSGDLLTSMILKIYRRKPRLETLFPGVPEAFKHKKEVFFQCLSIILLQRDFFPPPSSFKSASLTVGRTCISRVHRDFMRIQGCETREIPDHPLFDPDTMKCEKHTLERFELPFAIASSTSQTILPLICLDYHEVEVKVEFEGCVDDIVQVGLDPGFVFLDMLERRHISAHANQFVIQPVDNINQKRNVNKAGFVEFDISAFKLPTSVIAFRLLDARGKVVNPLRVAYVILAVNKQIRMAGSGTDFFTNNLDKDARLDNNTDYDDIGMFVFRLQAPTTDRHTDTVPHGTMNLSRIEHTSIQVVVTESKTGDEFTAEVFQQHVNVFITQRGLGALRYKD